MILATIFNPPGRSVFGSYGAAAGIAIIIGYADNEGFETAPCLI